MFMRGFNAISAILCATFVVLSKKIVILISLKISNQVNKIIGNKFGDL
jgi:hypothetical protein